MRPLLCFLALIIILNGSIVPVAAQDPLPGQTEFLAGLAAEFQPESGPNYQAAERHYQAAAQAGSREALLALVRLGEPGGPLPQNPEIWRNRLVAAAQAGWPEAAFQLAQALDNKTLTGLDPAGFYRQAAAASHGQAAFRLGQLYQQGQAGLPQDEAQAALWFCLAAAQHETQAAMALGQIYYNKNNDIAKHWLEKAALPESAYLLGEIHLKNKSFIEAVNSFTVAADQNHPPAHLALGLLNLNNDFGRRPNPREALRHFKIAAQADLPEGSYQLAQMYLTGLATPKDPITGAFWLHRAATQGHAQAQTEYEKWSYNFTIGQKKRLERMIEDGVAPTTQTLTK